MGQAIGQILSFGVGVALSPLPIIAVVLMLGTPEGSGQWAGFPRRVGGRDRRGGNDRAAGGGRRVGEQTRRRRDMGEYRQAGSGGAPAAGGRQAVARAAPRGAPSLSCLDGRRRWTSSRAVRSAAMGVALSAVHPKNLLIVVGAAAAIAQTGASAASQAVRGRIHRHRDARGRRTGRDLLP